MGNMEEPLRLKEEDMIERVATAIHKVLVGNRCDEAVCKFVNGCGCANDGARAAIEAMREPTEAQYAALSATGKMWRELNSKTVWQTYIDAALQATAGSGHPHA
jgi:hypothetical protein